MTARDVRRLAKRRAYREARHDGCRCRALAVIEDPDATPMVVSVRHEPGCQVISSGNWVKGE